MYSTLKLTLVIAGAGALAGTSGCVRKSESAPLLSNEPQIIDEAMQRRQWDQSVAVYPSGAAVAGPTWANYESKRGQAAWKYYYTDIVVFGVNLVTMPYYAVVDFPTEQRVSPGIQLAPTFTAVPPLPPEQAVPVEETQLPPEPPQVTEPLMEDSSSNPPPADGAASAPSTQPE